MESDKVVRLANWRRTLGTLCFVYVLMLLILKAPAGLAAAKHVWLLYLLKVQSRPLLVKSLTSATGFALGDGLAQTLQKQRKYSLPRTTNFAAFGLLLHGPSCHFFYELLDRVVQPARATSASAVLLKVLLDRVLLTPFILCSLFMFLAMVEGRLRWRRDRGKPNLAAGLKLLWRTWLLSNTVWPLAHVFNFAVLPPEQRVLFVNCVSVVWNAVLSRLAQQQSSGERYRRPQPAPLLPDACASPDQLRAIHVHVDSGR